MTEAFPNPTVSAAQLAPLFVERKTPLPAVPAKRLVPDTAKALTLVFGKPLLAAAQLVPLLVDRKTPPPLYPEIPEGLIPAKRLVPERASA